MDFEEQLSNLKNQRDFALEMGDTFALLELYKEIDELEKKVKAGE
jgi:hypothetical protein